MHERDDIYRSARQQSLEGVLRELAESGLDESRLAWLTRLLTEAALDGDVEFLTLSSKQLAWLARVARPAMSSRELTAMDPRQLADWGRLVTLAEVAGGALERLARQDVGGISLERDLVEPASRGHDFLAAIRDHPDASNADIARHMERATTGRLSATNLSHLGARMVKAGLADRRRRGRVNAWKLTPRGDRVLMALSPGGTPEGNSAVVRRFFDQVINHGRTGQLPELVSEEFREPMLEQQRPPVIVGLDGLRTLVEGLRNLFPNLQAQEVRVLAEGDLVAYWGCFYGNDEPPDGAPYVSIVRVRDGKISESEGLLDPVWADSFFGHVIHRSLVRLVPSTAEAEPGTKSEERTSGRSRPAIAPRNEKAVSEPPPQENRGDEFNRSDRQEIIDRVELNTKSI